MTRQTRHLSAEHRAKIGAALKGISTWNLGKTLSEEHRAKISAAMSGENNPFFGKTHSVEVRSKISSASKGRRTGSGMQGKTHSDVTKVKISATMKGRTPSEEHRAKISATLQGITFEEWTGFKSFEPYCPLFNYEKKEEIRNRDERRCQSCGKPEILNGERLSIHHINSDKLQGCHGKPWALVALCRSCNAKADTLEKEFLIVSNLIQRKGE